MRVIYGQGMPQDMAPIEFVFKNPSEEEMNIMVTEVLTREFPGKPVTPELTQRIREVILNELMTEQAEEAIKAFGRT